MIAWFADAQALADCEGRTAQAVLAMLIWLAEAFVITRTMRQRMRALASFHAYSRLLCSSWVVSPPTPVPTITAVRAPEFRSH
jgi:hypothetical protein